MKLAITGAHGFVGSAVVRHALAHGHEVVALVRRPRTDVQIGVREIAFDLASPAAIAPAIAGCECLVHAAAAVGIRGHTAADFAHCYDLNARAARDVALLVRAATLPRLVYLSSGYYAPGPEFADEDAAVHATQHAPSYVTSKYAGELLVRAALDGSSTSAVILRIGSVYGPGMNESGVLPRFVAAAVSGARLTVLNGGTFTSDFVHVEDVATAIIVAAERGGVRVVNIGGGERISIGTLARRIADLAGGSIPVTVSPVVNWTPSYPTMNISRARAMLGFSPRALDVGLAEMLRLARAQCGEAVGLQEAVGEKRDEETEE